ncbi:Zn-ribbon protein [Deinococcus geothermalis DSM 11300]|uniref:Zn-ribbon protein n=1 Tax=Deinococcus geothermalis (strain DSM 11300 / CIP 105573 / AG-3a) TaxID=319795 RepID=Q1IXB9_DEIGD|nr:Zn-ribbon protein [Deinococcus geothermalis DSM 11300]
MAKRTFGGRRRPSERPQKVCPVCGLPFTWRKKWERDWENVRYCSDRCRAAAKRGRT